MFVKIEQNLGNVASNKPSYMCSLAEFTTATTEEDGTILLVVDEASHAVTKYCIAYNGNWNEL